MRARLVARDAANDLAVLTTDFPQKAVPPALDPRPARRERLHLRLSAEQRPGLDRKLHDRQCHGDGGSGDDTRKIQISAPVQQGNSGGPALDQFGNVIGIVQSKQVAFASGDVPQNVNFAIKSTIALNFLEANGIEAPINVRMVDPWMARPSPRRPRIHGAGRCH